MTRRILVLLVVLLASAPETSAFAQAAPLDALLARLAKVEGLSAQFQEEKRMSLVAVPLKSEGTLYYQKPRSLARHTLKPSKSTVLCRATSCSSATRSAVRASRSILSRRCACWSTRSSACWRATSSLAQARYSQLRGAGQGLLADPCDAQGAKLCASSVDDVQGKAAELQRMELVDGHGDVTRTSFTQYVLASCRRRTPDVLRIGG